MYNILHQLSPIISLGFIYRDWFVCVITCVISHYITWFSLKRMIFVCYYMSYLPLYHLVLFIETDFYVLLHELSPIISLGFIYRDWFLAHLAKGNVSFCHHLASVVCHPLTFHILIFSSETAWPKWTEKLVGSIYGRSSIKIAHFVPIH